MAKDIVLLDDCDNAGNWTSSDDTYFTKSQETGDKKEGTGSIKIVTSSGYSADRCTGGSASADSYYDSRYTPSKAFDNDTGSRWSSNTMNYGWIQYDFGAGNERCIRRLRIFPKSASGGMRIKDFNFQVYVDGSWTTVYTGQVPQWNEQWYTFDFSNSYTNRYGRIEITSLWVSERPSIYEIEMKELLNALNDTITRDLGANGVKNLTDCKDILMWIKSSRTETYLQFGIGESAWNNHTWNITINSANTWELKRFSIANIPSNQRNAIRYLGIKCINADSNFTAYIDYIYGARVGASIL